MKEKIIKAFTKSVIWVWVMSMVALLSFVEYWIADVFKVTYNGLSYYEYSMQYMHNHMWLVAIGLVICFILSIFLVNDVYKMAFETEKR